MKFLLNKVYTPKEIYISWQEIPTGKDRPMGHKFIIGKLIYINCDTWDLQYFQNDELPGFAGYLPYRYVSNKRYSNVKDAFIKRLPPQKRGDFKDFLKEHYIDDSIANIDDFALLAYTGGRLPGDNFSFINPLTDIPLDGEFIIVIAGSRYYVQNKKNEDLIGQEVVFSKDTQNQYDHYAVKIFLKDGTMLGFVGTIQSKRITNLIDNNKISIQAHIAGTKELSDYSKIFVYVKTFLN